MAVRAGFVALDARGGSQLPQLSASLSAFVLDAWPPHAALAAAAVIGTRHGSMPVSAHGRAITGYLAHSYVDDDYYRVHITPPAIALGNLVSSQTRQVSVWNAYPDRSLTLQDVQAINADGIVVTGPGALPLNFAPLQERQWQLEMTTAGAAVVNATLRWDFTSAGDDVSVSITGNRITAWMVPPDWSDSLTETLTWLTDVENAVDGSQLRQPCREAPRRQWEFGVVAEGRNRRILEMALYDWSARAWALPVWTDVTWLTAEIGAGSTTIAIDTRNLDFVQGGLAMLWASATQFELVELAAIAVNALALAHPTVGAWPVGARLYPCRTATLTDFPALARASNRLIKSQVRFQAAEPCDWPAAPPAASYLGIPVLETRSNEPQDMAGGYGRVIVTIDNETGLPEIVDQSNLAYTSQQFCWLLNGRADRGAQRSLLYWLAGRAQALWLPSGNDDVRLLATAPATATALTVEWIGITRFGALQPGRRHLRIELFDGSVFYRRITAVSETDMVSEQLALDSPLGGQVAPSDVRQISWMMLATLVSDEIEIAHVTDSLGVATASVNFIGVPKDEP